MHPYLANESARRGVTLTLAAAATAIAWAAHVGLRVASLELPWWVDAPSVLGVFGVLRLLFDRWLWRWRVIQYTGLLGVPDLNGAWEATGYSRHEDGREFSGTIQVKQRWSRMSIVGTWRTSRSHSVQASLLPGHGEQAELTYHYENVPRADALETMQTHVGTVELRLIGPDQLEGEYYSGRGRGNCGNLSLVRK